MIKSATNLFQFLIGTINSKLAGIWSPVPQQSCFNSSLVQLIANSYASVRYFTISVSIPPLVQLIAIILATIIENRC